MPNVMAVRNVEPVDVNTSTDSASMRRVSAAIASDRLRNSSRNTGSANTSRYVAGRVMSPSMLGRAGSEPMFRLGA